MEPNAIKLSDIFKWARDWFSVPEHRCKDSYWRDDAGASVDNSSLATKTCIYGSIRLAWARLVGTPLSCDDCRTGQVEQASSILRDQNTADCNAIELNDAGRFDECQALLESGYSKALELEAATA
jgi:hypothetical protein